MYEYATGIKGFGGMEGTWRDAEDGLLGMNPIAQGSVDSTFSVDVTGGGAVDYWIICGRSLDELESCYEALLSPKVPSSIESAAEQGARSASALAGKLEGLPQEFVGLCETSLHVIFAHCDRGGAMIAALDSDIMATNRANYAYCWPRDGAHLASVLDRLGFHEAPRRFFPFCASALSERHPILLQKYRADATLGASWHPWIVDGNSEIPFQEDEAASVIDAFAQHVRVTRDQEGLRDLYPRLIRPMADFLVHFRDHETGLPKPSYDLWEERRGVHAYTCAAVSAGLQAAAEVGQPSAPEVRNLSRCRVRSEDGGSPAFLVRKRGYVPAHARRNGNRRGCLYALPIPFLASSNPPTLDSSGISRKPCKGSPCRGSVDLPDTSTTITSVSPITLPETHGSSARCGKLRFGSIPGPKRSAIAALNWVSAHAASTGILPEQLHAETGEPLSVSPLAWSHAEFLKTALDWSEAKKKPPSR